MPESVPLQPIPSAIYLEPISEVQEIIRGSPRIAVAASRQKGGASTHQGFEVLIKNLNSLTPLRRVRSVDSSELRATQRKLADCESILFRILLRLDDARRRVLGEGLSLHSKNESGCREYQAPSRALSGVSQGGHIYQTFLRKTTCGEYGTAGISSRCDLILRTEFHRQAPTPHNRPLFLRLLTRQEIRKTGTAHRGLLFWSRFFLFWIIRPDCRATARFDGVRASAAS